MATWELVGFSTEEHGDNAVRHREYTTSERTATLFSLIPRIDFTDSGHGIVFDARPHRGGKKTIRRMEHVRKHMALLRAEYRGVVTRDINKKGL